MLNRDQFKEIYKKYNNGAFGHWEKAYDAYCATLALEAAKDSFAPSKETQVNLVPCQQKGNNPMHDYDNDCPGCVPVKSSRASAGAGVIINSSPVVETAEEQRKYLTDRALDIIEDKTSELREK